MAVFGGLWVTVSFFVLLLRGTCISFISQRKEQLKKEKVLKNQYSSNLYFLISVSISSFHLDVHPDMYR